MSQTVVVIDPGHGGAVDPGATADNYKEANVNLAVCLELKSRLSDFWKNTKLTRTNNTFVSLSNRIKRADYYISIHHNRVVKKDEGFDVVKIYYVFTNRFQTQQRALAESIGEALTEQPDLSRFARRYEIIDGGHLFVLRRSRCPAVLVEVCYATPSYRKWISYSDNAKTEAFALSQGIGSFLIGVYQGE